MSTCELQQICTYIVPRRFYFQRRTCLCFDLLDINHNVNDFLPHENTIYDKYIHKYDLFCKKVVCMLLLSKNSGDNLVYRNLCFEIYGFQQLVHGIFKQHQYRCSQLSIRVWEGIGGVYKPGRQNLGYFWPLPPLQTLLLNSRYQVMQTFL